MERRFRIPGDETVYGEEIVAGYNDLVEMDVCYCKSCMTEEDWQILIEDNSLLLPAIDGAFPAFIKEMKETFVCSRCGKGF
jgi:hypothetical protein